MTAPDEPLRWTPPTLDDLPPPPEPEPEAAEAEEPPPAPPTLEEIQAIQKAARDEGFEHGQAEGHEAGFAQGRGEVRRLIAQIEGILDNFSRPLDRLEGEVVAALSELAVRIAGNLVGRAYEADPELLAALVHEALDSVRNVEREVEVRLHPDDIDALTPWLHLPANARLTPDPSLSRGDLRVHAETVRIDGTLDARLRGALETVLHARTRPDAQP